jgi:uncharacterized membrane protein
MRRLIDLISGFPGHPTHPPLTDASIGTYTVGVAMLIAGTAGLEEKQMAHGALIALSFGILLAAPTAVTGLIDWLGLEPGSPARRLATIHLFTMVAATLVFVGAWLAQRPGYNHDEVRTLALGLGAAGEALLAAGGYMGGTLVFVYAHRVLGRERAPVLQALSPGIQSHADARTGFETEPGSAPAPPRMGKEG